MINEPTVTGLWVVDGDSIKEESHAPIDSWRLLFDLRDATYEEASLAASAPYLADEARAWEAVAEEHKYAYEHTRSQAVDRSLSAEELNALFPAAYDKGYEMAYLAVAALQERLEAHVCGARNGDSDFICNLPCGHEDLHEDRSVNGGAIVWTNRTEQQYQSALTDLTERLEAAEGARNEATGLLRDVFARFYTLYSSGAIGGLNGYHDGPESCYGEACECGGEAIAAFLDAQDGGGR